MKMEGKEKGITVARDQDTSLTITRDDKRNCHNLKLAFARERTVLRRRFSASSSD